jgi:hypothetical protein
MRFASFPPLCGLPLDLPMRIARLILCSLRISLSWETLLFGAELRGAFLREDQMLPPYSGRRGAQRSEVKEEPAGREARTALGGASP